MRTWQPGIVHQRNTPAHPHEHGAHERMHRVLTAKATKPAAANAKLQHRVFNPFVQTSNDGQPHEALNDETPSLSHASVSGMFASARLHIGSQEDPVVPRAALRSAGGSPRVFVVREGHLEERLVQLGEDHGDEVAVLVGLIAGERIASPLGSEIVDGLKVE